MKKLIAIVLTAIVLAAIFVPLQKALAAPGDVIITLVIPVDKLADFRIGFLKARPIRGDYTEKEWITKIARESIRDIYLDGKEMIEDEIAAAAIAAALITKDPNVIQ